MAVYKDKWNGYKGNTWRVACYYKDWKGERKKHDKRGFHTKREALAYEREFLAKTSKDINMGFDTFVDIYLGDLKPRIKPTTLETKESIINTHIIPYFKQMSLAEITATDILQWQNSMLSLRDDNGKGYSQTYLRSVHNQLNAIFNHAVRYYDLPKNPCRTNKKMGKAKTGEMKFWTGDEYSRFSKAMVEKPLSYYAFELLYWTGIRCGELLALTRADFDLDNRKLRITIPVLIAGVLVSVGISIWLFSLGYIIHALWNPFAIFVMFVIAVTENYIRAAIAKQNVTKTFERYVAPNVVNEILKEGTESLKLGGKTVDIAVLFVDITLMTMRYITHAWLHWISSKVRMNCLQSSRPISTKRSM